MIATEQQAWTDNGVYHAPKSFHPPTCAGCTSDEAKHGRSVVRAERSKAAGPTEKDLAAFETAKNRITQIRADIEQANPEYKASEWQFADNVCCRGLTMHRINRLVTLGLLESKPSDGFGPAVRVNPEYHRYL